MIFIYFHLKGSMPSGHSRSFVFFFFSFAQEEFVTVETEFGVCYNKLSCSRFGSSFDLEMCCVKERTTTSL